MRKRFFLLIALILSVFFVSGCATQMIGVSSPDILILTEEGNISEAKNETKIEEKISEDLKTIIENTKHKVVHVIIQFTQAPSTPEEKEGLEERYGIKFHEYTKNNSWKITVPVDRINEIAQDNDINLVKDIPPETKIYKDFREGKFKQYEIKEGDIVTISVGFFSDVDSNEVEQIMSKYNAIREYMGNEVGYGPGPSNNYKVSINKNWIGNLAGEDAINYITTTGGPESTAK